MADAIVAQREQGSLIVGVCGRTKLEQPATHEQLRTSSFGERHPLSVGLIDEAHVVRALVIGVANDPGVAAVAPLLVHVAVALEDLDLDAATSERPGCGETHRPATDDNDPPPRPTAHSRPSAKP